MLTTIDHSIHHVTAYDNQLWAAEGEGEWIQYDLGEVQPVGRIFIAWHAGDQRRQRLQIAVSTDGERWEVVFDGLSSGTASGAEPVDVRPFRARYVRIVGNGNTANRWNSMRLAFGRWRKHNREMGTRRRAPVFRDARNQGDQTMRITMFAGPVFAGLLALGICGGTAAAEQGLPNIVLIISDDQGWTDYGFMGHPHIETPHLDRLAAEGLTFPRGYVPTSLCRPSLASIITGYYPHQHRLVGNDPPPPADLVGQPRRQVRGDPRYLEIRKRFIEHIDRVPTLPRMLGELGYLSHQSGKWWEGHYSRGGFTHGMTHGDRTRGGRHGDDGLRIGRQGMAPIFDFIDVAVSEEKPFFIWYAPFLPHTPHNPPERLLNKYREVAPSLGVARYWAMCEWFDETCGELLDFLDDRQLARETIVLFVCDNGWNEPVDPADRLSGGIGGPGAKRSPYDLGIRTPIMLRWPGRIKPQTDAETVVSSIDLAPTVLAAVGLEATPEMQGKNLLDPAELETREAVFGDVYEHDVQDLEDPLASLRYRWVVRGDYKLILPHPPRVPDGVIELFQVIEDPHEEHNLAEDMPELVRELTQLINQWLPVP